HFYHDWKMYQRILIFQNNIDLFYNPYIKI
ncbi:putative export s SecD/SecF fusion domain protein, partial [Chlamydia psittaci 84-8471/1]